MAAGVLNRQLLDALATHAAASLDRLPPSSSSKPAAGGGGFDDVRRKVGRRWMPAAAKAFVAATERSPPKWALRRGVGAPSVPPAAARPGSPRTLIRATRGWSTRSASS